MFGESRWSIRVRLTLTAGVIAALVCLGVDALVVAGLRGQAADFRREQASSAALEVVHLIKRGRLPAELPAGHGVAARQVLNARGKVVAASANIQGGPPVAIFKPGEQSVYTARRVCPPAGLDGCQNVVAFRVYQPDGDWTVYAVGHTVPWFVSSRVVLFLLAVSLLLTGLTLVGCWRVVGQTLAPVDAIRAELYEITATESGRRVPVPPNRDELRALAEAANATLDRLDAALEQQRRFTSDASHDLRSPITAARAQIEDALADPAAADWPRVGGAVLESLDRLQAIVSDLLELARLDAGATGPCAEPIDLATLVRAELARGPRPKPVTTDLASGVVVRGNRLRLARLLTNLVDNAERHAATRIDIAVRQENGTAILQVTDDGAGIAPADREIVFQRFTRLDAARNRDAGGTGLGLPIARQIALTHGGTLTIEDSPRGARLVLRLPTSP